jgi:hypothetical protein
LAIVTVPPFWVEALKTLPTPALKPAGPAAGAAEVAGAAELDELDELLADADVVGLAVFFLLLPHAVSTSAATAETAMIAVVPVLLIFLGTPASLGKSEPCCLVVRG